MGARLVTGLCARRRWLAGCGPAATHFLLLRQKKVSKEKATPLSATRSFAAGNLSCVGWAGNRSNSLRSNNRGSFSRPTAATQAHTEGAGCKLLVALRATLHTHSRAGTRRRCKARQSRASSARPFAVMRRRVAQGWADQGSRLSEAKPSSSETPPGPSNAAYRHTVPGDAFGSPFLCLLSFGEAKESECAAGRISRQTPTAQANLIKAIHQPGRDPASQRKLKQKKDKDRC